MGIFSLEATSLRLKNDTKNIMTVEIFSAEGASIGEEQIEPLSTETWVYENSRPGKSVSKKSITPLTVVWRSEKGDFFSACHQVASGSMVTPLQCRSTQ